MIYFFLTVIKATNAAAVKMNAFNVVESISAINALNFEAFNFFSHFEMIIQRSLTFKTLINHVM